MTHDQRRSKIEPRPDSATFFVTCLVDQFRPQVGDAVVSVLNDQGIRVKVPRDQTCCGQPAFNSGYREEARRVAARFLFLFDDPTGENGPIVTPSGSCAAMVRNYYPVLFRDDPDQLKRAKRVGDRLWEFSELLSDGLGLPAETGEEAVSSDVAEATATDEAASGEEEAAANSATYHRCCHALRELGIDQQPEKLLNALNDLEIKPLDRSEVCCGFGGSFSVKMPDISTAMLDEKLDNVEATGASRLIAGDTGCIMHMEGGLRRRGSNVQVLHIAEVLASSRLAEEATKQENATSPVETPADTSTQADPQSPPPSSESQEPAQ